MIECKMSSQEADMYSLVRRYRCVKSEGLTCPARLIIGQAGVVLDCPNCGSVGQTSPHQMISGLHLPLSTSHQAFRVRRAARKSRSYAVSFPTWWLTTFTNHVLMAFVPSSE